MVRRLAFILFLLSLSACATDERQIEACRHVFETLVGGAVETTSLGSEGEGAVLLEASALGHDHRLVCRFAGPALTPRHLDLMAVELDGVAISELSLVMLRHAVGLAMPPALLNPPGPPPSPALRGAYLVQQLINGLSIGAILALVATGYSLVYGITGTIQFAYGELFMIGAFLLVIPFFGFVALGFTNLLLAFLLALPVAALGTGLYGWTMARIVYRPLLKSGRLNALVAAIGTAIALREFVRLNQGAEYRWLPEFLRGRFTVFEADGFGVTLAHSQIVILGLAVALASSLGFLLMRTRWGRAHRACADDPDMASLLGVDIDATIGRTFALGAGMAALAGTVFALQYGEADAYMGYIMGFKALTAALLGGFGTVTGALLGGLVIGLVEALWAGYFGSAYTDAAVFSLLILVLVFRPDGLLGRNFASGATLQPAGFRRP
jgi:branched-chain amino acid transport system permease protein